MDYPLTAAVTPKGTARPMAEEYGLPKTSWMVPPHHTPAKSPIEADHTPRLPGTRSEKECHGLDVKWLESGLVPPLYTLPSQCARRAVRLLRSGNELLDCGAKLVDFGPFSSVRRPCGAGQDSRKPLNRKSVYKSSRTASTLLWIAYHEDACGPESANLTDLRSRGHGA